MSKRHWRAVLSMFTAAVALTTVARAEDTSRPSILTPQQMKWEPAPGVPKGSQRVVLYGDPTKAGPYAYRVKFPANYKLPAHSHSDDRTYTIISGTLFEGEGDKFDASKLKPLPAGSFSPYNANTNHYAATKGQGTVFQVSGNGPSALTYVNPSDDPRK